MRLQPHQLRAEREYRATGLPMAEFRMPAAQPKKKRSREESQMQIALLKWWHMQHKLFGVPEILLFSIPNGGGRSGPIIGSIMKAEGLRKGAPDLMLAVPRLSTNAGGAGSITHISLSGYSGLFLELKRRDGVLSPEQEVFHQMLQENGYKVETCWSLMDAINCITNYLTKI